jgi:hypothetical protein
MNLEKQNPEKGAKLNDNADGHEVPVATENELIAAVAALLAFVGAIVYVLYRFLRAIKLAF